MAKKLNITKPATKMRLKKHGIKPIGYSGRTALYDPSALEIISKKLQSFPKG
jgi:hypothetical protein